MAEPKPTVPEVLPTAKAFIRRNPAGCCLHLVLSDPNYNDACVRSCIRSAEESGHEDCLELAETLMRMSPTQRKKIHRGVYR